MPSPKPKNYFTKSITTSIQSFKAMGSDGYQKLPKAPSLNPFSCRESQINQILKELDQLYSQWETEHDRHMETMKKNKQPINRSTLSEDAYGRSFMKFGKQLMKMDRKRKEIVKEEEEDGYCSKVLRMEASFRFEQMLKELESMDMSNVEHILDIEEVQRA